MIIYRNPGSGLASFIILRDWGPRILASPGWRLSSAAHFSFELILTLLLSSLLFTRQPRSYQVSGNKTRGQRQYLLWENVVRVQIWWKLLLSYFGVNMACHVLYVSISRWQWHKSDIDIFFKKLFLDLIKNISCFQSILTSLHLTIFIHSSRNINLMHFQNRIRFEMKSSF